MTELLVFRGLPGSGKSTLAARMVEEHGYVEVNRGATRQRLFGSCDQAYYEDKDRLPQKEALVTEACHAEITAALKAGFDVVCSDTNLPVKRCRDLRNLAIAVGVETKFVDLSGVSLETCLERNAARTDKEPVPESVIRDMHARFIRGGLAPVPDMEEQDFSAMMPQGFRPTANQRRVWIVDIDGTLAHIPKGGRSPYDYTRVSEDLLDDAVASVVAGLWDQGTPVFLVSGRSEDCRDETEAWLRKCGVLYDGLYMRPSGDERPDWRVKYDLFNTHIRPRYWVEGVIDDRPSVCRMWRSINLKTFQVGDPSVEF